MQIKRSPHGSEEFFLSIEDLHHLAAVEFALRRAVAVDGAAEKVAIRPEEPACRRVAIGKGEIRKKVPFVLIHFGSKLRAGGDARTRKGKFTGLLFDDDIIAKVHAARSALAAGEGHETFLYSGISSVGKKGVGEFLRSFANECFTGSSRLLFARCL
jgi:hypothetical protein